MSTEINIEINNTKLKCIDEAKYLGIVIDSKLVWNSHINNICKKISQINCIFYRIRDVLSLKILRNLYYAFIYPYLTYGIEIWSSTSAKNINNITKCQKRIIRTIMFETKLAHTSPYFIYVRILPIQLIIRMKIAEYMHKIFYNNNKNNANINIRTNYGNIITRNTGKFFIQRSNTTKHLKFITNTGPRIWNTLPSEITDNKSYNSFKISLKNYLYEKISEE